MKTAKEILMDHVSKSVVFSFVGDITILDNLNANTIVSAMEEYASQFKQEWISINDKRDLKDRDRVLVSDGKFVEAGYYTPNNFYSDGKCVLYQDISHWMPLPTLYKPIDKPENWPV